MIRSIINIIIIVCLFQGCWFYSMRGSLPAHINSISLAPVVNESAEFLAAEYLGDELNRLTRIPTSMVRAVRVLEKKPYLSE